MTYFCYKLEANLIPASSSQTSTTTIILGRRYQKNMYSVTWKYTLLLFLHLTFTPIQAFSGLQDCSTYLKRQPNKEQETFYQAKSIRTLSTPKKMYINSSENQYPKNQIQQRIVSSLEKLDSMYTHASSTIKCPFWRRRAADVIDNVVMVLRFLVVRHKTLLGDIPLFELQAPGCKAVGGHVTLHSDGSVMKHYNMSLETLSQIIKEDWSIPNNKGYYITGRLNSTVYKDDCLFDGPDPDMPVRGLRKYLAAATHLFDSSQSSAELLSLDVIPGSEDQGKFGNGVIIAKWKIEGVLMLPWRPKVHPWTGHTKYHIDEDGLIALHEEKWDISVIEAFFGTAFPGLVR